MKPKLLVVELWGVGDLVIATPFLRAAAEKFEVTVLAKPFAKDLQTNFWPGVSVVPFLAPWTAFKNKYQLWAWPWGQIFRLRKTLRGRFDFGLSARWDPRDHFLLAFSGARQRLGFPRWRSQMFLTRTLERPALDSHRYESWRVLARELGFELPPRAGAFPAAASRQSRMVLVHTGAGQPVRVWPLEQYRQLVLELRGQGYLVEVACDPVQRDWWLHAGETSVATPATVGELIQLVNRASAFIGNDSGPGHLAALSGVPTFTFFGPQLPEWFAPLHPQAEWVEGKVCPFKPCSDYCRFSSAPCLQGVMLDDVRAGVSAFAARHAG